MRIQAKTCGKTKIMKDLYELSKSLTLIIFNRKLEQQGEIRLKTK